jgi:rubredoxin
MLREGCLIGSLIHSQSLHYALFHDILIALNHTGRGDWMKWTCRMCGYVYDTDTGDPQVDIAPGTAWENIPAEWLCPVCGAAKSSFYSLEDTFRVFIPVKDAPQARESH